MERILSEKAQREVHRALLVNRYATPLAIFLVGLGIFVSQPSSPLKEVCIGLMFFGVVFNLGTGAYLKHKGGHHLLIEVRRYVNLAVNVLLVYLLGGYFTPIWMILALTPLATAIYENRARTLGFALGVSAVLLVIHGLRGASSPLEWGNQLAVCTFIILVSLLVNEVSALAKKA
ncbi:MAG: hypothetical protein AAB320_05610 [Elusimicrobiota bacterium]